MNFVMHTPDVIADPFTKRHIQILLGLQVVPFLSSAIFKF
jgi:hypothetical protein